LHAMEKKQCHRAIIAIGSNVSSAEVNFDMTLDKLLSDDEITLAQSTQRVWTEPLASKGVSLGTSKFLNGLIAVDVACDLATLTLILKEVEQKLGASKTDKQRGIVAIDLDILSYDGERYHQDDWQRNYIKTLIKELL